MILTKLFYILLCMLSLGACKEEYSYPNVLTQLTEIQTDTEGRMVRLITDLGQSYEISLVSSNNKVLVADTLYRMLTVYELGEEPTDPIYIYSAKPVFSEIPKPMSSFENGIKTDPVDVQSIWYSGNYLNMILLVQTKNTPHVFHFVNLGIHTNDAPTNKEQKVLDLTIYHDRRGDYEAFTSKYCFSIPLKTFNDQLHKGDLIRFHLNTYKEGTVTREFNF